MLNGFKFYITKCASVSITTNNRVISLLPIVIGVYFSPYHLFQACDLSHECTWQERSVLLITLLNLPYLIFITNTFHTLNINFT